MSLSLTPEIEQRIQRSIDLGHYSEPAEVITHALNLLDEQERWLQDNKEEILAHLDEASAAIQRGEGIPADQVKELLARRRALRVNEPVSISTTCS